MARDSQLAGDLVQTEYYLQFADHYFRVLSESRARFEEQNPRRQHDDDGDDDDGDEEMVEAGEGDNDADDRDERPQRRDREERGPRRPRGDGGQRRSSREDRDARNQNEDSGARPHLNGGDSLPADLLPPAIGAAEDSAGDDKPARPRRARKPRSAEGEEEVAPAA
jgi:hypothetical protein